MNDVHTHQKMPTPKVELLTARIDHRSRHHHQSALVVKTDLDELTHNVASLLFTVNNNNNNNNNIHNDI